MQISDQFREIGQNLYRDNYTEKYKSTQYNFLTFFVIFRLCLAPAFMHFINHKFVNTAKSLHHI